MSLDVYLKRAPGQKAKKGSGIFIRENGATRELTSAEWDERCPGIEPVTISAGDDDDGEVYWANITHNLGQMASAAGIYEHLWRPEELGIAKAAGLIDPLQNGLALLESDPERFKQYDSPNGWGRYENLVRFVRNYLDACKEYPESEIGVSR